MSAPHLFSVDLEEHFQVNAFEGVAPRTTWDSHPSRVARSTDALLELFARRGVTATFFTLGWVAERQADLVRRIVAAGHEIASHTWWHRRISALTPAEFRQELRTSKQVLEQVSGRTVRGFRAPSFSIRPGMEWAFDVLLEEGYTWDSSLFPIRRPDYGYPGAPGRPHDIARPAGTILEFPLATLNRFGMRLPAAGGGYLRHFPLAVTIAALRQHEAAGVPAMLYVHPWEVDPEQPRLPVGLLTRIRHYRGLDRTLGRLDRLFSLFEFTSVERWLATRNAA